MRTLYPEQPLTVRHAVFEALRAKLCREISGSALLVALLEKLNGMELTSVCPETFKTSFDEFVARAADDLEIVRPFFPILVKFLPSSRRALALSKTQEKGNKQINSGL